MKFGLMAHYYFNVSETFLSFAAPPFCSAYSFSRRLIEQKKAHNNALDQ
jgi:hypothetical protein